LSAIVHLWTLQEQISNHLSLVDLVLRSSPIAKGVLLLLSLFSIFSWAIIIRKSRYFKKVSQQTERFLEIFRQRGDLSQIQVYCKEFRESPLTSIFLAGYSEIESQLRRKKNKAIGQDISINVEAVQRALQRAAIAETNRMEKDIAWLASTANASPFIGLFGTVVGIILAFQGLSTTTVTSIQAVAPGIAEALIATAAGIAAAVPAAIFYNHYLNKTKLVISEMDDFSLEFLNLIEYSFVSS